MSGAAGVGSPRVVAVGLGVCRRRLWMSVRPSEGGMDNWPLAYSVRAGVCWCGLPPMSMGCPAARRCP